MLRPNQILASPEFAATVDTKYITGLATLDNRMLIVINIEQLILSHEMALFEISAQ
jgi:purine-binding chemotaxis protein CheW